MGFIKEFKEFAMRGNVMDMAVGVVMGGAFGKIVSSVVSDVIMPPIGLLVGGMNFSDLKIVMKESVTDAAGNITPAVTLNYGSFLQTIFDFIIIAFAIFLLVKTINTMQRKKTETPATPPPPPTPTKEQELLTEIRDLLKSK